MDEPTKPEVGDPTTLNDVKNKDSHEQFDPFQEPENSPQDITDEFSKAMATALPDVLADISTDPGAVSRLRAFLAIVREETFRFMDPKEPPFLSQFFNFTEIEIKDADCSNDDFAEYKSFVQTAGEVGRRTTLTDYLIARKFQPLVQQQRQVDFTIAQMVQLRVDLKQAKRFVEYIVYGPLFFVTHKRANQIKAGDLDVNSILDDILLVKEQHSSSIFARRSMVSKTQFTDTLKLGLSQIRDRFYDVTKAKQDYLYEKDNERKLLADNSKVFLWDLIFNKYHPLTVPWRL
ncbi:hypothetical protein VE01_03331 [Pseudogymnoascus verrucosus]|uniref:Uncharacterized protein n=1 Tax=Pseudogymnoascus verrucosus TaxID=342668 RepID=A0A1B8GS82_9PEZI|nr:uncharacterized protein VE01_03331 [Pseudogymnoascus verrucosus]OBT98681.1 hypothetical protein VE01_03331 [Pseudogymnoascus verrucosus]